MFTLETQTNVEFWGEDAKQFNPDRFLEENFKKVHPYAYFPFSNGPRICLGHKYDWIVMKIFLSRFVMKYRVKTSLKYEELKYNFRLTTSLIQGARISLERR
jgi:cytochrome P450 family 4